MSANQKEFLRSSKGPGDPLRVHPCQSIEVDTARKSLPRVIRAVPSHGVVAGISHLGNQCPDPNAEHVEDDELAEASHRKAEEDCRRRVEWIRVVLFQRVRTGEAIPA